MNRNNVITPKIQFISLALKVGGLSCQTEWPDSVVSGSVQGGTPGCICQSCPVLRHAQEFVSKMFAKRQLPPHDR